MKIINGFISVGYGDAEYVVKCSPRGLHDPALKYLRRVWLLRYRWWRHLGALCTFRDANVCRYRSLMRDAATALIEVMR